MSKKSVGSTSRARQPIALSSSNQRPYRTRGPIYPIGLNRKVVADRDRQQKTGFVLRPQVRSPQTSISVARPLQINSRPAITGLQSHLPGKPKQIIGQPLVRTSLAPSISGAGNKSYLPTAMATNRMGKGACLTCGSVRSSCTLLRSFDPNSFLLKPQHRHPVLQLARTLLRGGRRTIIITGYSSSRNQSIPGGSLARKRAVRVLQELKKQIYRLTGQDYFVWKVRTRQGGKQVQICVRTQ